MKNITAPLALVGLTLCFLPTAHADTFGTGANQFTLDFVTISGNTNPTPAQANDTGRYLDGFGIVAYSYRMGIHEVTNSQWNKFEASLGVPVTGNPSSAYDLNFYDWGTGTTDVPTNNVSWYEAAQFVNWLNTSTGHQAAYNFTGTEGQSDYTFATWEASEAWGGTNLYRHKDAVYFLPDEDEWFKAAYWNGSTIQDYATKAGETLHQGDGTSGTGWNYNDGATNPDGPWNVGSGSEELNGTYDMMGNVCEWMESSYSDSSYGTGSIRGLRGGSFSYDYDYDLHAANRHGNLPAYDYWLIGFRVASIPEPASITLLLCIGVLSLMLRRRRK